MGNTLSKCLSGIVIPVSLSANASFVEFASCLPADIALRLKRKSFLHDGGMIPMCNAIIIPETILTTLEGLENYERFRIHKFYVYRRKSKSRQKEKLTQNTFSEKDLRIKDGVYYMFWRSVGYGYKIRRPRSKFPAPKIYSSNEERNLKNPYISVLFPEKGKATVELYITSKRTAEMKLKRQELDGIVISRIKGERLIIEYNKTNVEEERIRIRNRAYCLKI